MAAKVDKSKCAGCKSCIVACPVNAISMKDDVAEVNEADCVRCGRQNSGPPIVCLPNRVCVQFPDHGGVDAVAR